MAISYGKHSSTQLYLVRIFSCTHQLQQPLMLTSSTGGDSSAVQDQLFDVQHIQATESAFAAIRADGVVVCWGNPHDGGDCAEVQDQLIDVTHVQATSRAFAAIRSDGTVVTWGGASCDSVDVHAVFESIWFILDGYGWV